MFGKLFGGDKTPKVKKEAKVLPWQQLTDVSQLEAIIAKSKDKPQAIFKHSTRCGISRMVLKQFEADFDLDANVDLHYIDLLNYREVSNEVGYKFQVMHQSPQLVLVKDGVTVAHASHGEINAIDLTTLV